MKLIYHKQHLLDKLMNELLTIPALRPIIGNDGQKYAVFTLQGDGENIYLTVPDDAPIAEIEAVIQAHDPTPLPQSPTQEQRISALEEAILTLIGI